MPHCDRPSTVTLTGRVFTSDFGAAAAAGDASASEHSDDDDDDDDEDESDEALLRRARGVLDGARGGSGDGDGKGDGDGDGGSPGGGGPGAIDADAAHELAMLSNGSKRLISASFAQLAADGHDVEQLWEKVVALTRLTLCALQPELAHRYRDRFPRAEPLSPSECDRAGAEREDNSLRAFHIIGLDVLLNEDCAPRLLEINANPSLSIDLEREIAPGQFQKEVSPVDVAAKRRALGDALRIVAAGALPDDGDEGALGSYRPVVTAAGPIPPELSLLNECRCSTRASSPRARPARPRTPAVDVRAVQPLRPRVGILELVGMKAPELEILVRRCSAQKWTASAPRKLMYHTTFTATLIEIAARRTRATRGVRLRRSSTPCAPAGHAARRGPAHPRVGGSRRARPPSAGPEPRCTNGAVAARSLY